MPRSPILLALDTATPRCSVALARGDTIAFATRDVDQRHTEFLLPMADALLGEQGIELGACDAIAFGAGPGSFTGLRVACGAAQGLAYGAGRPVVPVGNLDATALEAFDTLPGARIVCVAIDARMHEVYCGVFAREGAGVREVAGPALAAPHDVVALAEEHGADAMVGSALTVCAAELARFRAPKRADIEANARSIVRLALVALEHGQSVEPAAAAPLYVRNRVALTIDERHSGDVLVGQGNR